MLILSILSSQIRWKKNIAILSTQLTKSRFINLKISISKPFTGFVPSSYGAFTQQTKYGFSKQRIIQQLQKFNQELDLKNSSMQNTLSNSTQEKANQFLQKQQKIVKDFLDLTQESFSQHLENQLKEKYHVDAQMLLMIVASLEDPKVIKQTIPKIYPFIPILEGKQLLLLFEILVAHKPESLPALSSITPRSLEGIESILLLLNEIYSKDQKLIQWLKEIPLYKGDNLCMMVAGFFAIFEKLEQHSRFKNQRIINRCIDRIVNLAADQNPQTQISIAILALQSHETGHFADKLLIELQKFDYSQVDPLKLQIFFIHLQKSLSVRYAQASVQASKKSKYRVLSQSQQGQVEQKQQEQYLVPQGQHLQYSRISQIERYKFLNSISKAVLSKIIDLDWNKLLKLNLLLEYWKVLDTFPNAYPWNSFKNKLITFTNQREIIKKMTNLNHEEILTILEVMDKIKINKSILLMRLLALISDRLGQMTASQLIRLAKVCVTFVRQCEDFLISVRIEIQNRKFIFSSQEIDRLNEIFKRVLVLFPRPLIK